MTEQFFYQGTVSKVHIHTVIPVLLLDQYIRRPESNDKVIGTLMGHLSNGVLEVRIAYAVPHAINDNEIAFGKGFNNELCELHKKATPNEEIVGWYCVSTDSIQSTKTWNVINTYYETLTPNPIFLNFDVSLSSDKINIQTYTSENIILLDSVCAVKLVKIPAEIDANTNENMIINRILKDKNGDESSNTELYNDISKLETSLTTLSDTIHSLDKYVNNIINKQLKPDKRIGRMLHNALSFFPQIDPSTFSTLIDTKIKDVALVIYLSDLAHTQLEVAEKINNILNNNDN